MLSNVSVSNEVSYLVVGGGGGDGRNGDELLTGGFRKIELDDFIQLIKKTYKVWFFTNNSYNKTYVLAVGVIQAVLVETQVQEMIQYFLQLQQVAFI